METIYESKFKTTTHNKEHSLITNVWHNVEMSDDDFKKEILVWVEQIEKLTPKSLIADTRLFNYTIPVQLQEWNGTEVFPRIVAAGVKKFGIVESQELVAQMSIEQTIDEDKSGVMQNKYFTSIDEALQWIK